MRRRVKSFLVLASLASCIASAGAADKPVIFSATEPMTTENPYAESSAPVYALWCHTYGCLGRYDYTLKKPVGILAEKWEPINATTWRFTLRKDLKRHDGGPGPTSADVIHSLDRIRNDPESSQSSFVAQVQDIVAVDEHTFDVRTKGAAVNLPISLFDKFIVTSADLFKAHGRSAYKTHPWGWGPYRLEEYLVDRRVVFRKVAGNPEHRPGSPELVIFQQMREPEQRVTALLNGEIQVARLVPPQLVKRLEGAKGVKVLKAPSIEAMFVAFNNRMEPWTDIRLRRAAAHAINRQLIIDRLLGGLAKVQDGPVGPEQHCYTGPPDRAIAFDQKKARELLAEAGYKDGGPEIEFFTANGRYTSDRQIAEAVAQMLRQAGFKVKLHAPEYANFWADVRRGKTPMYYMGRGSMFDASDPIGQLFVTGGSPRVQYSNPRLDDLMNKQYAAFDEKERCAIVREINQTLIDDSPTFFMHAHTIVTGARSNITLDVHPSGEFWLPWARVD